MALPDIEKLNKIFDDYLNSLQHQSSFKKFGFSMLNAIRSYWGPSNPYAHEDAEQVKINRMNDFKKDFEITKKLPRDKAIISWRKQLDIFNDEYKLVIQAEVVHLSKFGFAIRAASSEICNAMKDVLQDEINELNAKLNALNASIKKSTTSAKKPIASEIEKRNELLFELMKLGDKDAAHEAAGLSLLTHHQKPSTKEFTSPESSNAHVSDDAEIYPDIPWAYQPNLLNLYNYRLEKHEFPPTLGAWIVWKGEQVKKGNDTTIKTVIEAATQQSASSSSSSSSHAVISQQLPELTKNLQPQNTLQEVKEQIDTQQKKTRANQRKKQSQQTDELRDLSPSASM